MVGILVFGDNHLIVDGPRPDEEQARALARYWSVIEIGRVVPAEMRGWSIVKKAFRENLEWAWVVPGEGGQTEAVGVLLKELQDRGVVVEEA
ncbi:MAG: hypothetical protein ABI972_18485 [Acidobacteriota bacterium]